MHDSDVIVVVVAVVIVVVVVFLFCCIATSTGRTRRVSRGSRVQCLVTCSALARQRSEWMIVVVV